MLRPLLQLMDSFRRPKFVVCNCGLEVLLLLALEPLADLAEGLREQLLRLLLRLLLLLIPRRMQRPRLRHKQLHGRGRRRAQPQFKKNNAPARRALSLHRKRCTQPQPLRSRRGWASLPESRCVTCA